MLSNVGSLGLVIMKYPTTTIKNTPIIGPLAKLAWSAYSQLTFVNSNDYWKNRYINGGNSGVGSYGRLAEFKAEVINEFCKENSIRTVVEHGCGDGAQLSLIRYDSYLGLDISDEILDICRERFGHNSPDHRFLNTIDYNPESETFDLALSLDVIYHLIEDDIFELYMENLFKSSHRFVTIYASNYDAETESAHVRHRRFTDWIELNCPEWHLKLEIKNMYPFKETDPDNTSFADFHFFERK